MIQKYVGKPPFLFSTNSTILDARIDLGVIEYVKDKNELGKTSEDNIFVIPGNRSGFFKVSICTLPPNELEEREYFRSSLHRVGSSTKVGKMFLVAGYINPLNGSLNTKEIPIGNVQTISKDIFCNLGIDGHGYMDDYTM